MSSDGHRSDLIWVDSTEVFCGSQPTEPNPAHPELTYQFNWLYSGIWSSWPSSDAVQSRGQGSKYVPLVP